MVIKLILAPHYFEDINVNSIKKAINMIYETDFDPTLQYDFVVEYGQLHRDGFFQNIPVRLATEILVSRSRNSRIGRSSYNELNVQLFEVGGVFYTIHKAKEDPSIVKKLTKIAKKYEILLYEINEKNNEWEIIKFK